MSTEEKVEVESSSSDEKPEEEQDKIEDVCGDGGVIKEILKKGTGWEKPKKDTEVDVHYVGTLLDGTEFDSSRKRGEPFVFKVGHGVIKGWSEVIKTMTKGEIAKVTLKPEYAYGENGMPPSIPENATLVFEIELLRFSNEKDLTKDGGILKKLLKEGEQHTTPSYETIVVVSYEGKYGDAIIDQKNNVEITIGSGQIFEGLEKTIESMKVNEKCQVKIGPKYHHGLKGVPDDASVFYDVELHSMTKGKETWETKNFEEICAAASERKEIANIFFKEEKYDLAVKKYERALKFYEQTSKLNDDEKATVKNLSIVIHVNISNCYYNLKNYKKSVDHANKALDINGNHVKALYRKALALVEQQEWDEAGSVYGKALELEPDNKTIHHAKNRLGKIIERQDKKEQRFYEKLLVGYEKEMEEERKNNPEPEPEPEPEKKI